MNNGTISSPPYAPTPAVLAVKPRADFVLTDEVADLAQRSLTYLQMGLPIHFRGPAGTGKTTLALHTAAQLGRPVLLISGDDEFTTSDLVGGKNGYRYRKVVDRYIHSVLKYEESSMPFWTDNRLTTACRQGYTLVYDEFTRSRAEANNILLHVLEEGLLILPTGGGNEAYIRVHPDFRLIFTSNPQEYAGVHGVQDALLDRMVTLDLSFYGPETEVEIVAAKSGLALPEARRIVRLVRAYRQMGTYDQTPTMRTAIMLGQITAVQKIPITADDKRFVQLCLDVLASKKMFRESEQAAQLAHREALQRLIMAEVGGEVQDAS